jgi:hypothetical protein
VVALLCDLLCCTRRSLDLLPDAIELEDQRVVCKLLVQHLEHTGHTPRGLLLSPLLCALGLLLVLLGLLLQYLSGCLALRGNASALGASFRQVYLNRRAKLPH